MTGACKEQTDCFIMLSFAFLDSLKTFSEQKNIFKTYQSQIYVFLPVEFQGNGPGPRDLYGDINLLPKEAVVREHYNFMNRFISSCNFYYTVNMYNVIFFFGCQHYYMNLKVLCFEFLE